MADNRNGGTPLQWLREGDAVEIGGKVAFIFHQKIPQLIAETSADSGINWEWYVKADMAIPLNDGGSGTLSGFAVIGRSGGSVLHAILERFDQPIGAYASCPITDVNTETVGSQGMLSKRPKKIMLDLPGEITIGTTEVGHIDRPDRMTPKQEAQLLAWIKG